MPKTETRLTREEKEYIKSWCEIKCQNESGLVKYAIKRYLATNEVRGLEMPESLKLYKMGDKLPK